MDCSFSCSRAGQTIVCRIRAAKIQGVIDRTAAGIFAVIAATGRYADIVTIYHTG